MQEKLSDILDNLLGLLLLEGSYEIEEKEDMFNVSIQTTEAGRLIGARGQSLESLQLLVNQILSRKKGEPALRVNEAEVAEGFKRVILDVEGWRKNKEEELVQRSAEWAKQVLESKKPLDLEPMSPWQRRIVHMTVSEIEGVESESTGEGRDRHIVISLKNKRAKKSASKKETKELTDTPVEESDSAKS